MTKKQDKFKEGLKFDGDKLRWDLLPYDAVNEIVKVLTYGAIKYEPRNWEKGMNWSRAYGALQRHMTKWFHGQENDEESGLSHLAHAGCCLMFLLGWYTRNTGHDDRPKLPENTLSNMDNTKFMEKLKHK